MLSAAPRSLRDNRRYLTSICLRYLSLLLLEGRNLVKLTRRGRTRPRRDFDSATNATGVRDRVMYFVENEKLAISEVKTPSGLLL